MNRRVCCARQTDWAVAPVIVGDLRLVAMAPTVLRSCFTAEQRQPGFACGAPRCRLSRGSRIVRARRALATDQALADLMAGG